MRDSLSQGDEVITIGGIHGKVVKVNDQVVTLEMTYGNKESISQNGQLVVLLKKEKMLKLKKLLKKYLKYLKYLKMKKKVNNK